MDLSIIIVNYKTPQLLNICIDSISRFEKNLIFEIIVVDNNSCDESENLIKKNFPSITWINNGYNLGFAKANNIGLKHANGEYVLFLNADTYFSSPVLEKCILQISFNKKIGAVGCKLLNSDNTLQLSYHDGHKLFNKTWWRNPFVIKYFKGTHSAAKSMRKIKEKHCSSHYPDWISGAFLLMRKSDILKFKLYWDENFFLYWEDIELCRRIRKKGFKLLYYPDCSIIHLGGGNSNVPVERFEMLENGKLQYVKKTFCKFGYFLYKKLMIWELKFEVFIAKRSTNKVKSTEIFLKELEFYGVDKSVKK